MILSESELTPVPGHPYTWIHPHMPLAKFMPREYCKKVLELTDYHYSPGYISMVARGKIANKEVEQALAWTALETKLTEIFNS